MFKKKKSIIDLTRENLGILNIKEEYIFDDDGNLVYQERNDPSYWVLASGLLQNEMLNNEFDRITKMMINQIIKLRSTLGLSDTEKDLLARGTINGLSLLKEQLLEYKGLYDEWEENRKNNK